MLQKSHLQERAKSPSPTTTALDVFDPTSHTGGGGGTGEEGAIFGIEIWYGENLEPILKYHGKLVQNPQIMEQEQA